MVNIRRTMLQTVEKVVPKRRVSNTFADFASYQTYLL